MQKYECAAGARNDSEFNTKTGSLLLKNLYERQVIISCLCFT